MQNKPLRIAIILAALGVCVSLQPASVSAQWIQQFDGKWYQHTGGPFTEWTELSAKYDAEDMEQLSPVLERIRDETDDQTIYSIPDGASCGKSATAVILKAKDELLAKGWDLDQMNSVDPLNLVSNNGTAHTVSMFTSPKGNSYIIDRYTGKIEIIAVDRIENTNKVKAKFGESSVLDRYYRVMVNPFKVFEEDDTSTHFKAGVCPLPDIREFNTRVIAATDPNDKVGMGGAGESRYLTDTAPLTYRIRYENVDTASAPAQEVLITDDLDLDVFDVSTFTLGDIGFSGQTVSVPGGRASYATTIDLRPEVDIHLQIVAALEPETGRVVWRFSSIDPDTGGLPADPFEGFLPPNQAPPEGEGYVSFTVHPKVGLPTGTEIANKARIYFDLNEPIDTPPWVNVIDHTPPQSSITAISDLQSDTTVTVSWAGTDAGAGVATYSVHMSVDGGPFSPWLQNTQESSAVLAVTPDGPTTYAFYSIARDAAGNVEPQKSSGEASTTIVVSIEEIGGTDLPTTYALRQAYPNPAAGETTIQFDLPQATKVRLSVYDVLGREVAVPVQGEKAAGRYRATLDVATLAAGQYFYRMEAGGFESTKQFVVVR